MRQAVKHTVKHTIKPADRWISAALGGVTALALVMTSGIAVAAEQDAAKLGKELTAVGAERAGNKEGSIPEFKGGTPKAKHSLSEPRADLFADEKPLFAIDASSIDKYKDKLSAGQLELLKTRKGYRMDVYPTHRSCGYPDIVNERTIKNASIAKLSTDGKNDLSQGLGGAFPFPVPANGAEAVWNHKLRWQGEGRIEAYQTNFINPDGSFYGLAQDQITLTPMSSTKAKSPADAGDVQMKILNTATAPASRVGEIILAHYFLSKGNDAWMYFPGQRRVRRLPAFEYDNAIPGYENLETADQYPMFAGAIDRYDWKLVGKQEMYVPYNSFKFVAKRKLSEIYLGLYPNRDLMRYELHRVWKVEATVKAGMRHMFAKRTFYLDEDTWMLLAADQYDAQGKLWRVMEASLYPAVELGACVSQEFMSWDLTVNRYIAENATQESKPTDWLAGDEGRINAKRFDPDELRRAGER
jgi:hypothetical protein